MTATMTLAPLDATRPSLAEDQRGAVMLTGLFMSCFLIGALWFVVGIGDTVVFRDKMQEAADVGAFSSAALHAKGMNFISLCNLVMLVGTIIHIVLGIISDVKFALMVACALKVVCWPALPAKWKSFESAYNRWDNYFNKMSKGFKAIHKAQQVASYAYPAMGVVEAYQNGAKYGGDSRTGPVRVIAVSSSLIPGGAIRGLGGMGGGNNNGAAGANGGANGGANNGGFGSQLASGVKKEGLPVEAKPFNDLCKKVLTVTTNGLINLLGFGKSMGGGLGGKALSIFNDLVGGAIQFRYCNKTDMHFMPFGPGFDSFWGEDGPYVMYSQASNGNTWMQTWAINVSPKLNDTSESRVGIAAKQFSKYTKQEGSFGYFAQAEFYFDCDAKWGTAACNFEDNATYAIKWRARMRRLELPAITSGIVGAGLDALTNLPGISQFKDALPGKITEVLGGDGVGRSALNTIIKNVIGQVEGYIKGEIGNAAGNFDPTLQGLGVTPYH